MSDEQQQVNVTRELYRVLCPERRDRSQSFGLAIACLIDHAAAIATYETRLATEPDAEIRGLMADAQAVEFRHFGSDLEFLLGAAPEWRMAIEDTLAHGRPSTSSLARAHSG